MSGFPNKILALQFEWQWQNSQKSRVTKKRKSIENNKTKIKGYKLCLKVLHSLLVTDLWKQIKLVVSFLDSDKMKLFESFFSSDNCEINEHGNGTKDGNGINFKIPKIILITQEEYGAMHEFKISAECSAENVPCLICKNILFPRNVGQETANKNENENENEEDSPGNVPQSRTPHEILENLMHELARINSINKSSSESISKGIKNLWQ